MVKHKFIIFFVIVVFQSLCLHAFASDKQKIISLFQKLEATLEVGTSRLDIQKQLVDIKIELNQTEINERSSEFDKNALGLFTGVKTCFDLSDIFNGQTKRSASVCATETLKEELPNLKKLANTKSKTKKQN